MTPTKDGRPRLTREQIEARNAAIRAVWDDPLLIAMQRRRLCEKLGLPPDHITKTEDYNRYYREYRRRKAALREEDRSSADIISP